MKAMGKQVRKPQVKQNNQDFSYFPQTNFQPNQMNFYQPSTQIIQTYDGSQYFQTTTPSSIKVDIWKESELDEMDKAIIEEVKKRKRQEESKKEENPPSKVLKANESSGLLAGWTLVEKTESKFDPIESEEEKEDEENGKQEGKEEKEMKELRIIMEQENDVDQSSSSSSSEEEDFGERKPNEISSSIPTTDAPIQFAKRKINQKNIRKK